MDPGLFIVGVTLVLLTACWLVGDLELRTKVIFTAVYLATWVVYVFNGWACVGLQTILSLVIFFKTFGPGR
jgi:hypothetical protein